MPVPATSGIVGNYDATYNFKVCNSGGVPLTNIDLIDNFNSQFGLGFVKVVTPPSITVPGTNATIADPTPNALFTGFSPLDNLLNGNGGLESADCITVAVKIEVDASKMPIPTFNQATAGGKDPSGNPITDLSPFLKQIPAIPASSASSLGLLFKTTIFTCFSYDAGYNQKTQNTLQIK